VRGILPTTFSTVVSNMMPGEMGEEQRNGLTYTGLFPNMIAVERWPSG